MTTSDLVGESVWLVAEGGTGLITHLVLYWPFPKTLFLGRAGNNLYTWCSRLARVSKRIDLCCSLSCLDSQVIYTRGALDWQGQVIIIGVICVAISLAWIAFPIMSKLCTRGADCPLLLCGSQLHKHQAHFCCVQGISQVTACSNVSLTFQRSVICQWCSCPKLPLTTARTDLLILRHTWLYSSTVRVNSCIHVYVLWFSMIDWYDFTRHWT